MNKLIGAVIEADANAKVAVPYMNAKADGERKANEWDCKQKALELYKGLTEIADKRGTSVEDELANLEKLL